MATPLPTLPAMDRAHDALRRARQTALMWFVQQHWPFLVLLAVGVVLRCLVQATYEPAIFFYDSYSYLGYAFEPAADSNRPLGYPVLFLRPLLFFGGLALIPLTQHLLGLAMAAAIYVVLLRWKVRGWLAALAAAPVLLDGYQLQIEQNIMSDTFFQALIVGAAALLAWQRPARMSALPVWSFLALLGVVGLLLGVAATVRSVALPLLLVVMIYVVLTDRRLGPCVVRAATVMAAGALPLLVYSGWVYQQTGVFRPGTGEFSAHVPYVRTAPLADCTALATGGAPAYIVDMCPTLPRAQRSQQPGDYQFRWRDGPAWTANYPPGVDPFAARREFGRRVTLNQPLDVAGAVAHDFLRGFAWQRTTEPGEFKLGKWRFHTELRSYNEDRTPRKAVERYGGPQPSLAEKPAAFFQDYQSTIYTRGPVFAAGLVLPVLAFARARILDRAGLAAPALLVCAMCTVLLLAAATFTFSWRYQLPAIPLYPWSAVMALASLFPSARSPRARSSAAGTCSDPTTGTGQDAP